MISKFEPRPSALSEWHHIIQLAQQHAGYELDEGLEHYLMLTLDSFTTKTELGSSIIAIDFMQYQNVESSFDLHCLRNTGDQCLILSGLFAENIKKRNSSTNYIIKIGRNCYEIIANLTRYKIFDRELFAKLRDNIIAIIKTLQQMRNLAA